MRRFYYIKEGVEIALIGYSLCCLRIQCAQHEYLRYLSSHPEFVRYLLGQYIHIPAYLVVGDFRINLGRRDNILLSTP